MADEILDRPELERHPDDTGACRAGEELSALFHRDLHRPSGPAQALRCIHWAEVDPVCVCPLDRWLVGEIPLEPEELAA